MGESARANATSRSKGSVSARSRGSASARTPVQSALGDLNTNRSQLPFEERHLPPKPGALRQQHSQNRVEPNAGREVTGWFESHKDKQKRGVPFFAKPVANMGSSSVKYEIIS